MDYKGFPEEEGMKYLGIATKRRNIAARTTSNLFLKKLSRWGSFYRWIFAGAVALIIASVVFFSGSPQSGNLNFQSEVFSATIAGSIQERSDLVAMYPPGRCQIARMPNRNWLCQVI